MATTAVLPEHRHAPCCLVLMSHHYSCFLPTCTTAPPPHLQHALKLLGTQGKQARQRAH